MDTDKLSNFIEGIRAAIAGTESDLAGRFIGYAEGVDAAHDVDFDFDPTDYDAEDLFARYFG